MHQSRLGRVDKFFLIKTIIVAVFGAVSAMVIENVWYEVECGEAYKLIKSRLNPQYLSSGRKVEGKRKYIFKILTVNVDSNYHSVAVSVTNGNLRIVSFDDIIVPDDF